LIRQPVPEENRQAGFEQDKKSDVFSTGRYCFDSGVCQNRACEKIGAPALAG